MIFMLFEEPKSFKKTCSRVTGKERVKMQKSNGTGKEDYA